MKTSRINARRTAPPDGEELFRTIVDSIKDYAIFMLDADGHVQTWNQGARIIKGYSAEEIIGQSITRFYTPEDLARKYPAHLLGRAVTEGRVEDEGWRVRKDGTRFWADVVITAIRDDAGNLLGFAKVTRDLTERKKAETERQRRDAELARSEQRFRLLLEAVEDYAVFMLDPEGFVATWNSGAERMKGYKASEIIGKHFSLFRQKEDVAAGKPEIELATAVRDGHLEEEGWRLRKDGTQFWANVVLTAIRDEAGTLLGFAKVTRDLTERRRLDDERLHRARAEEAVRLRDEFLSIASHELRTPLTALQIELHSWQERIGTEDPRMVKRFSRAVRNAERLAALIDSLLDVSRIANGKLTIKRERFDLSETLAQVVDSLQGVGAKAGSEILFETSGPIVGSWDRLRVDQVVINLLSNAFKYGAGAPIKVSLSTDAGDAVIEITDRGPGIPAADLARIFGRFERAASVRHYGGLGLGLYVSREIVAALQGTIGAHNLDGGGACFTIRLPMEGGPGPDGASQGTSTSTSTSTTGAV